ncbi:MAG TPA: DUF4340 domain-containing protein [Burkholderiales bacterium]|nr:DUF4340 domain-containing protein [Burkholderiales bacterium]
MLRSWLSLAVLALVVVALTAWLFHYRTPPEAPQSYALSTLKAAEVKHIRLEPSAGAPVELEREGDAWRITSPFAARADAARVERLLAILDARSIARLPSSDLARYDLDRPLARVTLGGQTFAYGALNQATREQYVLTNDAVYAVPLSQRIAVPRDADALIARSLFAPGETPVRFDLEQFTAALEGGVWAFVPSPGDLTPDERNAWADGWRNATAVRAARHEGSAAGPKLTVHLKDGRTIELAVLAREPELVLLRADQGIRYHFLPEVAKRLMSPPAGAAGDTSQK